jgi:hypothetical protein
VVILVIFNTILQEFDPEKFYKLLEEAEGQVKETVKKDIPQYIFNEFGLSKETLKGILSKRMSCYLLFLYNLNSTNWFN